MGEKIEFFVLNQSIVVFGRKYLIFSCNKKKMAWIPSIQNKIFAKVKHAKKPQSC